MSRGYKRASAFPRFNSAYSLHSRVQPNGTASDLGDILRPDAETQPAVNTFVSYSDAILPKSGKPLNRRTKPRRNQPWGN